MIKKIIFKILSWSQNIPNKSDISPPFSVEQFLEWHKPRRGNANPQLMSNPIWKWLIETKEWPHSIHKALGIEKKDSPIWCFSRFGQSETLLADGSKIYIGGEHEDSYDEDFYIYNDVVVERFDGLIEIYGYPVEVFPPTDFHSATLVGDKIYIIGCLGYPEQRNHDDTAVYILDLRDYSIKILKTKGGIPQYLFEHQAIYSAYQNMIICKAGQMKGKDTQDYIDNIATWQLNLSNAHWQRIEG